MPKKFKIKFCEQHLFGAWELYQQSTPIQYCKNCRYRRTRYEYYQDKKAGLIGPVFIKKEVTRDALVEKYKHIDL